MEFELAYLEAEGQHFSHYAVRTPTVSFLQYYGQMYVEIWTL